MENINEKALRGSALLVLAEQLGGKLPTKVSELTNDSKFQTEEQVSAAVNAKLSSTYKAGGSAAFADLPELTEANLGLVVNVTDGFTTTDSFVEGAGQKHPAGTNVAVVQSGEEFKYDVMAGFVDTSGLVEKEDGKGLSSNDFTDADKAKLASAAEGATKVEASDTAGCVKINGVNTPVVEFATDEEVAAMLAEVFGS